MLSPAGMPRRASKVPSVLREEQGMHREDVGSVDGLSWGQGGVGYLRQVCDVGFPWWAAQVAWGGSCSVIRGWMQKVPKPSCGPITHQQSCGRNWFVLS